MSVLAIVETNESGQVEILHNLGDCTPEEYSTVVEHLTQPLRDWDSLFDVLIHHLQQAGFLTEEGFSAAGHTFNDLFRSMRDMTEEALERAEQKQKELGKHFEPNAIERFLMGSNSWIFMTAIRAAAKVGGKKGRDIDIDPDQLEDLLNGIIDPMRRQLLRSPERDRLLGSIINHYFPTKAISIDT